MNTNFADIVQFAVPCCCLSHCVSVTSCVQVLLNVTLFDLHVAITAVLFVGEMSFVAVSCLLILRCTALFEETYYTYFMIWKNITFLFYHKQTKNKKKVEKCFRFIFQTCDSMFKHIIKVTKQNDLWWLWHNIVLQAD